MTKAEQEKAIFFYISLAFLIVMIAVINLWLAWIQFNRFLFWFDIIFIPLSFVGIVVSAIAYFKDEWNQDEWLIVGGVAIGILLLATLTINNAYNRGYSEDAIQTKAELEKMLEDYTFILSIYTGEFRLNIQGMVINEFNKALCEAAIETPCEQVIQSYDVYRKLVGWKQSADSLAIIWK